jgi:hypothetical protein
MKAWNRAAFSLIVLSAVCAGRVHAQDDERSGMGAFLDWIHKLSGPRFFGGGLSYFYGKPGEGLRVRLTASFKFSFDERDTNNQRIRGVRIDMLSLQPTVEYGLDGVDIDLGTGFAFDYYFGGSTNRVTNWSFPLYAQYRSRNDDEWLPRLGVSGRLQLPFGPDDFDRIPNLEINRTRSEFVFQAFAGVDRVWR